MTTKDKCKEAFLRIAPRGTTLFSMACRNREGTITGVRYIVAPGPNEIVDVTIYVAALTDSKWNDKTGIMRTSTIGDAVDLLAFRLFDDLQAYNHKSLIM